VNLYSLLVYIEHNGDESPKDIHSYIIAEMAACTGGIFRLEKLFVGKLELCNTN